MRHVYIACTISIIDTEGNLCEKWAKDDSKDKVTVKDNI
jgi:hypothetical protein